MIVCNDSSILINRTWMVIRKDGALFTARQDPRLVLVKPSSKGDNLCLDAPGMETLLLPKFPEINDQSMFIMCRIWNEYITGLSCGEEANAWIRKYLGNEELGLVVSTSSMEKRDMCLVQKPYVNPAKEGDIKDWWIGSRGTDLSLSAADLFVRTLVEFRYPEFKSRTWMVIRKDGALFTARQDPRLVLVKPSSKGDNLCLDAPGMETLLLPKFPEINDQSMFIMCRIWNEYITGLSCGEEANAWIRKYLGNEELGLVVSTSSMEKRDMCLVQKPYVNPAKEGDISAFQDWGGYMVLSEASVDDLNTRLKKKVTMEHFRPNISIAGCTAYDEENWSEMRIGDKVYMRLLDVCERCSFPTIDPLKGERDPERQPLKTLKSYKYIKEYDITCFGVNAALDVEGEIKVGDPVYVLRKQ